LINTNDKFEGRFTIKYREKIKPDLEMIFKSKEIFEKFYNKIYGNLNVKLDA